MTTNSPPSTTRGHGLIETLSDTLELGESTQQIAQIIFNQTEDQRNGRSVTIVASSCLYLACKQDNLPTAPDDIVDLLETEDYSRKQLLQMSKNLDSELGLGINLFNPDTYVSNYCDELELTNDATQLAQRIVRVTTEEGVASGRSPTGFAAAAVYYASILANEKRTQQAVSNVANVSEVTIRNTYHDQADCIGDRLNQVI